MVLRFEPGEAIALREVWRGRVWGAIPARVVEDAADIRRFYVAPHTVFKSPRDPSDRWLKLPVEPWELADRVWPDGWPVLSFAFPDEASATLLLWDAHWRPLHWYVNLQGALERSHVGFDLTDHVLDVIVSIDRTTVRWKDEDELAEAIGLGMFTPEEADAFRVDGERAVARLVGREPPFDRGWVDWRPNATWTPPELPAGWDRL